MVEICSKSLVRAFDEVLLIIFSYRTPIKTHEGVEKWPLLLFWWSASITLDNNNAVLTDL